jgi:transposase
VRADLPEPIIHHTLEPSQLVCPCCGKLRPELSLREQSQEIGWEVRLVRRRHVRFRYGPNCQCPQGRGIVTAPKAAKLIAKGLLAVDFWVEVLLKKFEFQQPLQRTIREVAAHGMHLSGGTLSGGLKKIKEMVQPGRSAEFSVAVAVVNYEVARSPQIWGLREVISEVGGYLSRGLN